MPLILNSPPLVEPLMLAEAKLHLRISHGDDDAFIDRLISAARRQVEARTGLRLISQNWSAFWQSWPDDGVLALPLHPVQSVSDLKLHGEDDVAAVIDPAHYFLDQASHPNRLVIRQGRVMSPPGRRANGIELMFEVGFGPAPSDVPQDLRQVMLITIAAWFANRGEAAGAELPALARDLLTPYRLLRLQ
jgi:uncharacterized phiE125 gp8 family phage protein